MLEVYINPLVSELRVIEGRFGEPYEVAITIQYLSPHHVELKALDKKLDKHQSRAIDEKLREIGVKWRSYERRNEDGSLRNWVTKDLRKKSKP